MRIDWHFPNPLVLNALDVSLILLVFVLFVMVLILARRPKIAAQAPEKQAANGEQSGEQAQVDAEAQETSDAERSQANLEENVEEAAQERAAEMLRDLSPDAAFQVLSLLQQEARLIDFLSEDLGGHADADIGAVARVVHEGGRRVLENYFVLSPIRVEDEETQIEIPSGFDAQAIRLTGNVTGQPPYRGTLTHRGWRVSEVKLPKISEGHEAAIIAPAEVEV